MKPANISEISRTVSCDFPVRFNYSAMNNFAVEKTDAPWILFLNNDTEVIESEWLTAMAEHVQRPEIGAVGARLIFRDETIQHAGVVLGVRGMAKHAFCGFPAEAPGVCRQLADDAKLQRGDSRLSSDPTRGFPGSRRI